ncbi:MAG: TonB-dependent receptor [Nitrospinae bacterium]|nr:TonB-dependent receptor [Nitrospinota bacterium]
MRPHFLIAITVVLWMGFAACMPGDSGEPTRRTQFIMGTLVEITVSHADPHVIQAVTTQAFDEMKRLEQLMSTYLPDSEISQINRAAGKEAVPVSLEVEEVNPKFGVQWDITRNLRFRSALFQTVKPALVSNRTIEPTQIAGFNQLFDDVNATRSRVYGVGLDWRATGNLLVGAEAAWRELDVPIFVNSGVVSQQQDEQVYRAYINWTPMAELAVSAELVYDRFEAEKGLATASGRFPEKLATTRIPLAARYFHPKGYFAGIGATYVHQTVRRSDISPLADGTDEFVVVDAALGYRLPRRRGTVSLELRNLFDREFNFQDDGFREFADEPSTGPYIPDRVVLLRVSLNF